MDAEMLKVIIDNYEARIEKLESDLYAEMDTKATMRVASVCLSRGGHELETKGSINCKYKQCKHCHLVIDEDE